MTAREWLKGLYYCVTNAILAWWRLRVTRRCCRTCDKWDAHIRHTRGGLVGQCHHNDQESWTVYNHHCKNWHRYPKNP